MGHVEVELDDGTSARWSVDSDISGDMLISIITSYLDREPDTIRT